MKEFELMKCIHRLNLVKLLIVFMRFGYYIHWSSIVGALLMLTLTPITHFLGIFITMASSILSLVNPGEGINWKELTRKWRRIFGLSDLNSKVESLNANLNIPNHGGLAFDAVQIGMVRLIRRWFQELGC